MKTYVSLSLTNPAGDIYADGAATLVEVAEQVAAFAARGPFTLRLDEPVAEAVAEREGEESPRWLGLDDIPFQEPPKDEAKGWLPTPITDPEARKRVYEAAERLWNDCLQRRKQDRARAQDFDPEACGAG